MRNAFGSASVGPTGSPALGPTTLGQDDGLNRACDLALPCEGGGDEAENKMAPKPVISGLHCVQAADFIDVRKEGFENSCPLTTPTGDRNVVSVKVVDEFVSRKEAAEMLGLRDPDTVSRYAQNGVLEPVPMHSVLRGSPRLRFRKSEVLKLKEGRVPALERLIKELSTHGIVIKGRAKKLMQDQGLMNIEKLAAFDTSAIRDQPNIGPKTLTELETAQTWAKDKLQWLMERMR